MPITNQTLTAMDGWAYNSSTTDSTSGLQVIAAPGSGKYLVVRELHITAPLSARAFIASRESATAAATTHLGPIMVNASGYAEKFVGGLSMVANEALYLRTSAACNMQLFTAGYTRG